MKRICNLSIFNFLAIHLVFILGTSCKTEDPNKPKLLPVLTTTAITKITQTTAVSGGNITSDGGLEVSARGVCWSLSPNPTINDSTTKDAAGTGAFTSNISNLIADTTYYVRAYATNKDGTGYGFQVTFKTLASVLPILTTTVATDIAISTATSGGNISFNGGSAITARGVCWSTLSNPTTANSKTIDGAGLGSFTSSLTGLSANKLYNIRSYATNNVGTAYGNQVSFTTLASSETVTDIDSNVYNTVKIGTQTWMVENLKTTKLNDGTAIPLVSDDTAWSILTTPGYCYYYNVDLFKTTYGALYNWCTVNTGKLAPTDWHVPTDADWTTLASYLIANGYNYDGTTTYNKIAKSLAATTRWFTTSWVGAIGGDLTKNNTSGFTAMPGGSRIFGTFVASGSNGYWWSSSEYDTDYAWSRYLDYRAVNWTETAV